MNTVPNSILEKLKSEHGIQEFTALSQHGQTITGEGTRLTQLKQHDLGPLTGIYVEVPVAVSLETSDQGTLRNVHVQDCADDDLQEAVSHVLRLARRGQIDADNRPESLPATHAIETDGQGRRILVRRRYS